MLNATNATNVMTCQNCHKCLGICQLTCKCLNVMTFYVATFFWSVFAITAELVGRPMRPFWEFPAHPPNQKLWAGPGWAVFVPGSGRAETWPGCAGPRTIWTGPDRAAGFGRSCHSELTSRCRHRPCPPPFYPATGSFVLVTQEINTYIT